MVKSGAVVIDVGFNRMPDDMIVGDVEFEGVKQKASHITPVLGGVGLLAVQIFFFWLRKLTIGRSSEVLFRESSVMYVAIHSIRALTLGKP